LSAGADHGEVVRVKVQELAGLRSNPSALVEVSCNAQMMKIVIRQDVQIPSLGEQRSQ